MPQWISNITLGVEDLARARAFYEAMGFRDGVSPDGEVVFFQDGGLVFALWSRELLTAEAGVEDLGGFGGVSLAHNVHSPEDVDRVLAEAESAGGRITRPARTMEWGGYSGAFADPDGHAWEVAHNPGWPLAQDGSVSLS